MSEITTERTRVVAYRRGSFDAFIAAFIYWKLFGSARNQAFYSVDPFTKDFVERLINKERPDYIISIGANIERAGSFGTDYSDKFDRLNPGVLGKLFSYEVAETFPDHESDEWFHYFKHTDLSLTQTMLHHLAQDGHIDTSKPSHEMMVMRQFFGFSNEPKYVVHPDVAEQVAALFPNMLPEDFEFLDKLLYNPTSALNFFSKKSVHEVQVDHYNELVQRAKATVLLTGEDHAPLRMINSYLYSHPLITKAFAHETVATLVYEITQYGLRGKLIAPTDFLLKGKFDALSFFHNGKISGDRQVADVLLPLNTLTDLFC